MLTGGLIGSVAAVLHNCIYHLLRMLRLLEVVITSFYQVQLMALNMLSLIHI